jgi:hypothetical protein
VERLTVLFREDEWGIFGQKTREGPSNPRKIMNESLIKPCKS